MGYLRDVVTALEKAEQTDWHKEHAKNGTCGCVEHAKKMSGFIMRELRGHGNPKQLYDLIQLEYSIWVQK